MPEFLILFLILGSGLGAVFFLVFLVAATTPPLNTFFTLRLFRVFGLFCFLISFVFFVDSCAALLWYVFESWGVVNV